MATTVEIRGIKYPVEKFTNNHLQKISEMLVMDGKGHFNLGSLSLQSECAEVVLEVMVPTLPDDVISISPRGKYIWHLDLIEIPVVLMQIVRVWRLRQIEVAKARKDRAAVALHEEHLRTVDEYLAEFTPLLEDPAGVQGPERDESDQDLFEVEALRFEPEARRIEQLEQELAQLRSAVAQDPSHKPSPEPSAEPAANE